MQFTHKCFLSSLLLTAALVAPSAINAAPRPRGNGAQEEHRDEHRVYDA
jgi:hypothetical protein